MLAEAFPRGPVIAVICDNDSIHHARAVTSYLQEHPRLERIWAALKNYVANTAAPWTSPWLPSGCEQNLWNAA